MQGSTQLWEELPTHVMDVVLNMHDYVLRQLIEKWKGYESTFEGVRMRV